MWREQGGKGLTGKRNDGRSLGVKQLSIDRRNIFCSSCYLLVHSSLVGVEETNVRVGDFQVVRGVEPFVSGIEWLRSKHRERLKEGRLSAAFDLPPIEKIGKLLPSSCP